MDMDLDCGRHRRLRHRRLGICLLRAATYYQELAGHRRELIAGKEPLLRTAVPEPQSTCDFKETLVARISDFLNPASLARLREEAVAMADRKTRNFVPTHKKGGTVSYEQIHQSCPACLAFYHGEPVVKFVSQLVGVKVGPAGDHDQSTSRSFITTRPATTSSGTSTTIFIRGGSSPP